MKIIHGIGTKESLQATLSGHPYRGPVGTEGEYRGWRCELLITTRDVLSGEEEPIYLEGSADDVGHALRTALAMLEAEDARIRTQFGQSDVGLKG